MYVSMVINESLVVAFAVNLAGNTYVQATAGITAILKVGGLAVFAIIATVHTMVYTVLFAVALTVLFDLSRIAAHGAIFYLIMDIAIHWGLLRHLRSRIDVQAGIVITAIVLDVVVLVAFLWVKASADALILYVSAAAIAIIVVAERLFMQSHTGPDGHMDLA